MERRLFRLRGLAVCGGLVSAVTDAQIGANLRRLRTERHTPMTQAELANRLDVLGLPGMRQQTIAKIEKSQRPLRLVEADVIATALGVSVERLVEVTP